MPWGTATSAGAADGGGGDGRSSMPMSQLPWGQIPHFTAGETDLEDYAKKLMFLHSIWPEDAIGHLAPRAALQCDAVAFKKGSKIEPDRLKSKDGCEAILNALGMQWGRFQSEDRYVKFERALFLTTQKPDESNDSYIARHEACFEEILQKDKGVTLEEIRAYVMIRHSQLTGDEKKRIIVDNKGILTYDATRDAMRLLGSRFFQDLQGGGTKKWKTYDVHSVDEQEPTYAAVSVEEAVDEEHAYQVMLEQGDEDAIFINDFEDQIIEAVQESGDLAHCFLSYQEARSRLRERARHRGFWPPRANPKGKGYPSSGKKGSKGTASFQPRRTLAERIANSTCRICGKAGHWKRECPQRPDRGERPTEMATMAEDFSHENPSELPEDLPDGIQETFQKYFTCLTVDPIPKERDELSSETHLACERAHEGMLRGLVGRDSVDECLVVFDGREFKRKLSSALNNVARQRNEQMSRRSAGPPQAKSLSQPFSINQASLTSCKTNVAEETSGEAILDTGASRTIIGSDRVPGLIEALKGIEVQRGPSRCVFRFGNSGLLHSEEALFLKRFGKGWLRVEIVPGSTPFLISNAVLEGMRGILDVHEGVMRFHGSEDHLKLRQVRKRLNCVNVRELLCLRFVDGTGDTCLHAHEETKNETNRDRTKDEREDEKTGDTTERKPKPDMHGEFNDPPNKERTELQQTTDLRERAWKPRALYGHQNAALQRDQDHPPTCQSTDASTHGSQEDHSPVSTGDLVGRRGRRVGSNEPPASYLHLQGADRDPELTPVGCRDIPVRKTQGQDISGGLRPGQQLCSVHPAQHSTDIPRHVELPEFHQGSQEDAGSRDASAPHSAENHSSSPFCNELGSCPEEECQEPGASHEFRGRVESRGGRDFSLRAEDESRSPQTGVCSDQPLQSNAMDRRSAEGSGASDPDRDPSERAGTACTAADRPARGSLKRGHRGTFNSRSPYWNTDEVHKICQELICKIEDGLSTLPQSCVSERRPPRSGCSRVLHNRPVDCLEVYCFKNSQLTQQVNGLGGKHCDSLVKMEI